MPLDLLVYNAKLFMEIIILLSIPLAFYSNFCFQIFQTFLSIFLNPLLEKTSQISFQNHCWEVEKYLNGNKLFLLNTKDYRVKIQRMQKLITLKLSNPGDTTAVLSSLLAKQSVKLCTTTAVNLLLE